MRFVLAVLVFEILAVFLKTYFSGLLKRHAIWKKILLDMSQGAPHFIKFDKLSLTQL